MWRLRKNRNRGKCMHALKTTCIDMEKMNGRRKINAPQPLHATFWQGSVRIKTPLNKHSDMRPACGMDAYMKWRSTPLLSLDAC